MAPLPFLHPSGQAHFSIPPLSCVKILVKSIPTASMWKLAVVAKLYTQSTRNISGIPNLEIDCSEMLNHGLIHGLFLLLF